MTRGNARTYISVDLDSAPARRELDRLKGSFRKTGGDIDRAFGGRVSGMFAGVGESVAGARLAFGALSAAVGSVGTVVSMVGAAFAVAGAAAAVAVAPMIEEQRRLAERVGVSVEALSSLAAVARDFEVDVDDVQDALGELQQRAVNNTKDFERFGIAVKDSNGQFLDAERLLLGVAEAVQGAATETEKMAIADDLLSESGRRLLPILRQGGDGIQRLTNEAKESGRTIDDTQAKIAGEYTAAWRQVSEVTGALTRDFGSAFLPVLRDVGYVVAATIEPVAGLARAFAELVRVRRSESEAIRRDTVPALNAEAKARQEAAKAADEQKAAMLANLDVDAQLAEAFELARRGGRGQAVAEIRGLIQDRLEIQKRIQELEAADLSDAGSLLLRLSGQGNLDDLRQRLASLNAGIGTILDREVERSQRSRGRQRSSARGGGQGSQFFDRMFGTAGSLKEAATQWAHDVGRVLADAQEQALQYVEELAAERERRSSLGIAGRIEEDLDAALGVVRTKGNNLMAGLGDIAVQGTEIFSGMGTSIGQSFAAAFSGGDFGQALAAAIGAQLVSLGTQLVQAGTFTLLMGFLAGIPIIGNAFGGPGAAAMAASLAPLAIAGGIGMIGIGAAMGGGGAPGGAASGPSGGGGGAGATRSAPPPRTDGPRYGPEFGGGGASGQGGPSIINVTFNAPVDRRGTRREIVDIMGGRK